MHSGNEEEHERVLRWPIGDLKSVKLADYLAYLIREQSSLGVNTPEERKIADSFIAFTRVRTKGRTK